MLDSLFKPRGVAVIGASTNPTKLGYGVARNLVVSGYRGKLYFVNPRGGVLFDRELYVDVSSVPDPLDLAIIIIPAKAVPDVLEECGQRGVRYVIVGSGGFRETGPEGAALEQRCLEITRKHKIRVLGPNCIGFLDTHLPIDTTFLPLPGPTQGDIGFVSHSGAVCEAVIDWARGDAHTRVVAMYPEGIVDGARFIDQARRVTCEKPVIAIKVGVSEAGRAAVASHTGALAGQDKAYDAAFRKAGVIRARHSEEMFNWAQALAWCPLPQGDRVAILTNAGGPGAIASDAIAANHLSLAALGDETVRKLKSLLPSTVSIRNPIDLLAGGGPQEYAECLGALIEDDSVDAVIVILVPPPMSTAAEVAGALIPLIHSTSKPVVVTLMGQDLIEHAARMFRQARIPDYRFPERAASAIRVLLQRAVHLRTVEETAQPIRGIHPARARKKLESAEVGEGDFIGPSLAAEIVQSYGLQSAAEVLTKSVEEAQQAANEVGFPLALKVASADIPHKSDVGGVLLNVRDAAQLESGFATIVERARATAPEAKIEGVIVQPMIEQGQEVIVGVVRDQQFGPLVMFGSGGVEVEALRDVAFELAPLRRFEAERMLESTWAGKRLKGYRNLPPADREAVIEALLRIGQLAVDLPDVMEVEINPLCVLPEGEGAVALDVRLRKRVRDKE
ncbi:MAG: acetate--CoA ligase family protein [Anaerolineales bacterium]